MRRISELADMTGRVAVITGGAGHLGRAMAGALIEYGCHVVLADRDSAGLAAAADGLRSTGLCSTVLVDLEDEGDRIRMADEILAAHGKVDILVNNAGFVGTSDLQGWGVSFQKQSIATWRRALEVNLTAPFHLAQLFVPSMAVSGYGSIVNISSIYGVLGPDMSLYDGLNMGNPAAYSASKGGLVQLTRWMSTVLAPAIRVNCIAPGGLGRGQPEPFVERYVARTPLTRMGKEEDFVGAVAYLASDMSAWVTGQCLMVDGGWSAW